VKERRDTDRRPTQPLVKINDAIRVSKVRLIDENGQQQGVVSLKEALAYAEEKELDLVQMAEGEDPPCRVMNYSKYRYEQQRKEKEQRKHSQKHELKQLRLRPKIAPHDFEVKRNHAAEFLKKGATVQIQVVFRGAEQRHPEIGEKLLARMVEELSEVGKANGSVAREGRVMNLILQPIGQKN
jgi:translation initiation factor IF-3